MSYLALNPIKTIVKHYCPTAISGDSIRYIRDFLEKIVIEISKLSIETFYEYNRLREIQGLPLKKRLDARAVKEAIPIFFDNFYKRYFVDHLGLQSQEVESQGGNEMWVKEDATKSAKDTILNKRKYND